MILTLYANKFNHLQFSRVPADNIEMHQRIIKIALVVAGVSFCGFLITEGWAGSENKDYGADSHSEITCSECHEFLAQIGGGTPVIDYSQRCRSCHELEPVSDVTNDLLFHSEADRACIDCHDFHVPTQIQAGDRTFNYSFSDSNRITHCLACQSTEKESLSRLS